ncbi:putative necrosis-inducing factor-domain-containing protein [Hypoxylon rubiginosum]|uniref:Necrosis-inducing factor-domain-containing protein n=1 Tax=Hypoxylon rubiginosum TaxID=110542 RepID=A0ACB9Z9E3_9PEZI|nr:putative necrosis-inducing factor-domain-containing protein [Hypoxylon rubiginosum]
MKMHLAKSTALAFLGASSLGTAVRLPGINGEYFKQYANGNGANVYIRNSYHDGLDAHSKRFYETYHNDTKKFEICAETNFVDTYTTDGALGADCSDIMEELEANPGYFETGDYVGSDYNYLAVCGTCAFGVYRLDGSNAEVNIGSKDVVDNIYSALNRFQRNGHVGAKGNFTCGDSIPISWAILKAT